MTPFSRSAHPTRLAAVFLSAGLLAGCALSGTDEVVLACPPAQIAVPADRIGHSNQSGELRFVASMDQLSSSCELVDDDIEVAISFTMSAERGPAFEDEPVRLTYFIATVDPSRTIVDKKLLTVQLDFESEQAISALREAVTLRLPTPSDASGANYSLYLGFQPDEQGS